MESLFYKYELLFRDNGTVILEDELAQEDAEQIIDGLLYRAHCETAPTNALKDQQTLSIILEDVIMGAKYLGYALERENKARYQVKLIDWKTQFIIRTRVNMHRIYFVEFQRFVSQFNDMLDTPIELQKVVHHHTINAKMMYSRDVNGSRWLAIIDKTEMPILFQEYQKKEEDIAFVEFIVRVPKTMEK